MSKLTREVVGSVCKPKDTTKAQYIKFKKAVTFKEGDFISVETKKYQLASLDAAVEAGRLSNEIADKMRTNIKKMPEWVIGDLVRLVPKAN